MPVFCCYNALARATQTRYSLVSFRAVYVHFLAESSRVFIACGLGSRPSLQFYCTSETNPVETVRRRQRTTMLGVFGYDDETRDGTAYRGRLQPACASSALYLALAYKSSPTNIKWKYVGPRQQYITVLPAGSSQIDVFCSFVGYGVAYLLWLKYYRHNGRRMSETNRRRHRHQLTIADRSHSSIPPHTNAVVAAFYKVCNS